MNGGHLRLVGPDDQVNQEALANRCVLAFVQAHWANHDTEALGAALLSAGATLSVFGQHVKGRSPGAIMTFILRLVKAVVNNTLKES